jgi:hypothetical protein
LVERKPLFPEAVSPLVDIQTKLDRIEQALSQSVQEREIHAAVQAQSMATLERLTTWAHRQLVAVGLLGLLTVGIGGVVWWKVPIWRSSSLSIHHRDRHQPHDNPPQAGSRAHRQQQEVYAQAKRDWATLYAAYHQRLLTQ